MSAFDVVSEDGLPVKLPSGATFYVLTKDEEKYFKERVTRYLKDNHFVNVSDMQDVDRMIEMELLTHRWALWLSRQKDYFGDAVDERALRSTLNDYSGELRQLKKSLGIDKVARDKQRGDDSVQEYLANLRVRAKEFGVNRSKQFDKVIELFQQAQALLVLHDNSDPTERMEQRCTTEDVLDWFRTVAFPEFNAIDEEFRNTKQKMWVRSQ